MAKRQTAGKLVAKQPGTAAPAPIGTPGPLDMADFPDALAFINSLSDARDGIEWDIKVYQATGTGGRGNTAKPQFLFSVGLEDLPQLEERLAELYAGQGGGEFRVHVRADNQLVKNISLSIAPRPGWRPPPPSYMLPAAAQLETATPAPQDRMELFFQRLAEQSREDARLTRELIAAIAKPMAAPPTITEQLAMFKQFQELAPQGAQQNGIDMFTKGMDMAKSMMELSGGNGGGGGKGWLDVFSDVMNSPNFKDMISAIAASAGAQAAAASNARPALAPPSLVDPANPQAAQLMDTLLKQAALNVAPEMVAKQILEMAPPALLAELELQDDISGYIIHKFPKAATHRGWLAAVVANIWEEDDGADAAPPSPTLSNPPNAQATTQ